MIIYHLFINGKYQFKTNAFEEIYKITKELDHIDIIVSELIENHEYHLYDSFGRRKIDVVVSQVGD